MMEIHFHGYPFQLLGDYPDRFLRQPFYSYGDEWWVVKKGSIGLVRVVDLQNKNYYVFGEQGRTPNRGRFKGRHVFSIVVAKFQSRYETFHSYNLVKLYLSSNYRGVSECNVKV